MVNLKNEGEEAGGSQAYVPPHSKLDKQLIVARQLLRGETTVDTLKAEAKKAAAAAKPPGAETAKEPAKEGAK